jgi:hypothetical protein
MEQQRETVCKIHVEKGAGIARTKPVGHTENTIPHV